MAKKSLSGIKMSDAAKWQFGQSFGSPLGKNKDSFFFWVLIFISFLLRSYALEMKPAHFDEGINGNFVYQMWHDGFYRYDPTNFHGPLYFYVLQLAELTFGYGLFGYRFATGLFSLATVVLMAKHSRFFGRSAIWAAGIYGLSTASIFYSRYAIHESLFVLGEVMFCYGFFLWQQEKSRASLIWMNLGFFIDVTTKETFVIFFATWAIAVLCIRFLERIRPSNQKLMALHPLRGKNLADASSFFCLGLLAVAVLFSGFFLNSRGIADFFNAFLHWTQTGVGKKTGHEKPFFYWCTLMLRYEWPMVAAFAAMPFVAFVRDPRRRLLSVLAFGLWLASSIIPYKTPWLILNILWPLAFVGAFAIDEALLWCRAQSQQDLLRALLLVGGFIVFGHSLTTMYRINFHDFAKIDEPYVYVQSTIDLKNMMDPVHARIADHPEDITMRFVPLLRDPWPLPYIMVPYRSVAWGRVDAFREFDDNKHPSDVILVDGADQKTLEGKLVGSYYVMPFRLRDAYESGFVYYSVERFRGYLPHDLPVFHGKAGDLK
jgi:uncharacterized protein (TIGR03663 family)